VDYTFITKKESVITITIGLLLFIIGLMFWSNEKVTYFGLNVFLGIFFIIIGIYLNMNGK
jgi:uncharacterized membrane protein HdeD (DUF308 family)